MRKETRTVVYDDELQIEDYRFEGIVQPFPNHFHEHYVIGFVEDGHRALSCKNRDYSIECGNVVLFNPGDNHACVQSDDGTFHYRGFNISMSIMLDLAEEVTGKRELPGFSQNVIYDDEITCYLRPLHEMVMSGISDFGKEENLLFLISALIQKYGQLFESCIPECPQEIEKSCEFMRQHFSERIYLDQICSYTGLSKSTLLRAFSCITHDHNMGNNIYFHKNSAGGFQARGNSVFPFCHGLCDFACNISEAAENKKPQRGNDLYSCRSMRNMFVLSA